MAQLTGTDTLRANIAQVELAADGKAMAKTVAGRLLSLTLTESREDGADKLEFVLDNADGKIAPVKKGVTLSLKMGWRQGAGVVAGLVDKGRYTVDEVEKSGPPDVVKVRARSADLTGSYRRRRTEAHKDTTLGALIQKIAGRNRLTAKIHASLASKVIEVIEQGARSDMAFVRDLGKRFDATATVKDRNLIFAPIGIGQSAGGAALPALTFTKRDGWTWTFTATQRGEYDGAEAQWHDQAGARRQTVKVGGTSNAKRLRRVYGSEAAARAAAQAEFQRQSRGTHTFTYDLALGDPAIYPDRPVTLQGWDAEIDAVSWIVKDATHSFSAGGLTTRLTLESKGG